jgi:hypothetical protein
MSPPRAEAEIERDIARTRHRLDKDLAAVEQEFTPRRLAMRGTRLLGRTIADELDRPSSPMAAVLLPFVLVALGVVWLSLMRSSTKRGAAREPDLPRLSAGI